MTAEGAGQSRYVVHRVETDGTPKRAGGKGLGEIDSTLPSPGGHVMMDPPAVTVTQPGGPPELVTKGAFRPTPDFADHVGKPVKISKWTKKRIALTVLASIGGLLVVAAVALAIFWSPISRWLIHRAASARGVELEEKALSLSLSRATVTELEARFPKAKGVVVRAKEAEAELSWLSPDSVRVSELAIDADSPQSILALGNLVTGGSASDLPLKIDGAKVTVKRIASSIPIGFEFAAKKITHKGKKTELSGVTSGVPIIGAEIGPFDLTATKVSGGMELTTPSLSNVKFLVDAASKNLTVSVAPTALDFIKVLAVDKKSSPSLTGEVAIALSESNDELSGVLQATVSNFALPQLEGVLPGDLKISGEAKASLGGATLEKLRLEQGPLVLTGKGKFTVLGLRAEVDLEGALPCSKVAGEVLAKRFGIPGIGLLGGLIGGSIAVKVHVEAGPPLFIPSVKVDPSVNCTIGG